MKSQVHLVGKRKRIQTLCAPPCIPEGVEPFPPALGTGPVPRGKGGGFIEEEQLRIATLGHHDPMAVPEFQNAADPAPAFILANDFAVDVQDTAAIAHDRSACGCPEQVAEGIDAVLQGHSKLTSWHTGIVDGQRKTLPLPEARRIDERMQSGPASGDPRRALRQNKMVFTPIAVAGTSRKRPFPTLIASSF